MSNEQELERPLITFKPEYLHHFIEDEVIKGYESPVLNFYFTPATMDCYFTYTFSKKQAGAPKLEDLFTEFFVNGLILDKSLFLAKLSQQQSFEIPGAKVGSIAQQERTFDVFLASDRDRDSYVRFNNNIQIFLKFFIETGSYVDAEDVNWKFIFMFENVRIVSRSLRASGPLSASSHTTLSTCRTTSTGCGSASK